MGKAKFFLLRTPLLQDTFIFMESGQVNTVVPRTTHARLTLDRYILIRSILPILHADISPSYCVSACRYLQITKSVKLQVGSKRANIITTTTHIEAELLTYSIYAYHNPLPSRHPLLRLFTASGRSELLSLGYVVLQIESNSHG